MFSVFEDSRKRMVKIKEEIKFTSFSSYHLIVLTARVKSEKQMGQEATDDEDLILKLDQKTFPQLNSERLIDSPAAFSGGKLHNFAKTVYLLTFLKGKEHSLVLETDEPFNTATFESLKIYTLNLEGNLTLETNVQAEDGDRRSWLTFTLDKFPLRSITPTIIYSRRKRDSDDVKIKIDGKTQENIIRTIKHFLWRFAGSFLPWLSPIKTETQTFTVNLPRELHYLEFDADRMPILDKLVIDFGEEPPISKELPTVDNPKWTGNFYDDTEIILLARLTFGEAEDQSDEAKIWAAGSILNRVKAEVWPSTIHGVILQPDQYDCFKPGDPNYPKVIDPLKDTDELRKNAWRESYGVAKELLFDKIQNPTEATHFHGRGVSKEWFMKNVVPNGRFIRQIDDTYFYWSPN